jgi:hypothetical protein
MSMNLNLTELVAEAITDVPASAGTIRNRMLAKYRGTATMAVVLPLSAQEINKAAASVPSVMATQVWGICRPSGRARDTAKLYEGWVRRAS